MPEYSVSLDHEEANAAANTLSITGRVNGVQVAAKVKLTELATAESPKALKQRRLIEAFLARTVSASAPGERVVI